MKNNNKNHILRNIVLTILIIIVPWILNIILLLFHEQIIEKIYNCTFNQGIITFAPINNYCSSNATHAKYVLQFIIDITMYSINVILPIIIIWLFKKSKEYWAFYILPVIKLIYSLFVLLIFAITIFENIKDNGKFSVDNIYAPFVEVKKPIIYIYPEEKMDLNIKLVNKELITHSYPKYKDLWNINVDTNGNIYDYDTKRNYYALYWEGKRNNNVSFDEGFVVKGEDTIKFLEEKLNILGLNEKEINEFIIYWLPQMENNKYNIIRFKTKAEIENYMPLEFSKTPYTLIRVYMDFKSSNKKIKIKEQILEKVTRKGFTIVEWGGSKIK